MCICVWWLSISVITVRPNSRNFFNWACELISIQVIPNLLDGTDFKVIVTEIKWSEIKAADLTWWHPDPNDCLHVNAPCQWDHSQKRCCTINCACQTWRWVRWASSSMIFFRLKSTWRLIYVTWLRSFMYHLQHLLCNQLFCAIWDWRQFWGRLQIMIIHYGSCWCFTCFSLSSNWLLPSFLIEQQSWGFRR
jgi:hypothetical protein